MADGSSCALESFLQLAKVARGLAAARVVSDATSAPAVFAFGELLDAPHIQELAGTEHGAALELLRVFAFGTLADYRAASPALPPLSPPQLLKLKQLTVASLAESNKLLSYAALADALETPLTSGGSVRSLEDFIINQCFAPGVLTGKLDQRRACVDVSWSLGRDIKPGQLSQMVAQLGEWSSQCDATVSELDGRVKWASTNAAEKACERLALNLQLENVKKGVKMEAEVRGGGEGAPPQFDKGSEGSQMAEEDRLGAGRTKRRR